MSENDKIYYIKCWHCYISPLQKLSLFNKVKLLYLKRCRTKLLAYKIFPYARVIVLVYTAKTNQKRKKNEGLHRVVLRKRIALKGLFSGARRIVSGSPFSVPLISSILKCTPTYVRGPYNTLLCPYIHIPKLILKAILRIINIS